MRGGHRNRTLHVRVRRHQRRLQTMRLIDHRLLKALERDVERLRRVHRPKTRCGRDLVVAASARVQLRRGVADLLVEQPIDQRVHVLVRRRGRFPALHSRGDAIEATFDLVAFVERQNTGVVERDGPRLGQPHVVRPETIVDGNGRIEGVELRRDVRREAPAPELVRGAGRRGRRRRHAICNAGSAGVSTGDVEAVNAIS